MKKKHTRPTVTIKLAGMRRLRAALHKYNAESKDETPIDATELVAAGRQYIAYETGPKRGQGLPVKSRWATVIVEGAGAAAAGKVIGQILEKQGITPRVYWEHVGDPVAPWAVVRRAWSWPRWVSAVLMASTMLVLTLLIAAST